MNKAKVKDILIRAAKTFIQAFIGSLGTISLLGVLEGQTAKRIAIYTLISAIAAGVSAVWNMFLNWIQISIGNIDLIEAPDGEAEDEEEEDDDVPIGEDEPVG